MATGYVCAGVTSVVKILIFQKIPGIHKHNTIRNQISALSVITGGAVSNGILGKIKSKSRKYPVGIGNLASEESLPGLDH